MDLALLAARCKTAPRVAACVPALLALLMGACGSEGHDPDSPSHIAGANAHRDASAGETDDHGADSDDEPAAQASDDAHRRDAGTRTGSAADAGAPSVALAGPDSGGAMEDPGGGAMDDPASCDGLTYESFGEAFMGTYCTVCHNSTEQGAAPAGIVLDTLPAIIKNKSHLTKVVAPRADGRNPAMPKGGDDRLTNEERIKFDTWIDCGPN
jgi:hypothetical protein